MSPPSETTAILDVSRRLVTRDGSAAAIMSIRSMTRDISRALESRKMSRMFDASTGMPRDAVLRCMVATQQSRVLQGKYLGYSFASSRNYLPLFIRWITGAC